MHREALKALINKIDAPTLKGADLSRADLSRADLTTTDLGTDHRLTMPFGGVGLRARSSQQARQRVRRGARAEWIARQYLWCKGFAILEQRFRCPLGEIDLVAKRGDLVVFVEVKFRRSRHSLDHAVQDKQAMRISRAAGWYIKYHPHLASMCFRFDVLQFVPWRWPRHIIDAWREKTPGQKPEI